MMYLYIIGIKKYMYISGSILKIWKLLHVSPWQVKPHVVKNVEKSRIDSIAKEAAMYSKYLEKWNIIAWYNIGLFICSKI